MGTRRQLVNTAAVGSAMAAMLSVGVIGGIGFAAPSAIPDKDDGTVHLCYKGKQARNKDGGAFLRIYDSDKSTKNCKDGDSALNLQTKTPPQLSGSSALPFGTVNTPAAFADVTGYAINLPAAGTYLLTADIRGRIQTVTGIVHCYVVTRLVAGATEVPGSLRGVAMMDDDTAAAPFRGTTTQSPTTALVTVAGPTTVKVQHKTDGTQCANSAENIFSDNTGTSTISYVRISS
jgi:hypothetical protein